MIIEIIIIFAILQYLVNILFKPKYNTLNCGIFGQLTKNPNTISVPEFNILGIYNIERGKNSCGITYDGDIQHGINNDKLYTDFIKNRNIKPKLFPTIIGHTRQASVGNIVNLDNAHPFGFGELEDTRGYAFIGVHNGTLKNHELLAEKYNIDLKVPSTYGNVHTMRTKIDSEILLEILWKTQTFKVLSEYVGAAALAWCWNKEPNKVYLWSGASKEWDYTHSKVVEERPLCVYLRSKNNMFISSIEESLTAIGGNKDNTFQIDYNTVYCVTDGDFKNAQTWKVSRDKVTQNEVIKVNSHSNNKHLNYNLNGDHDDPLENYYDGIAKKRHDYIAEFPKDTRNINPVFNIHNELTPFLQNEYKKRVYFNKLRYFQKGHCINGVYIYIKNYGFYYIDNILIDAKLKFEKLKGLAFENGEFVKAISTSQNIPFHEDYKNEGYFYFVEGVMMKSYLDYLAMADRKKKLRPGEYLPYRDLSYVSRHPVINISSKDSKSRDKQEVLYEGVLCNTVNGGIAPLGSERIYYINNGNVTSAKLRFDNVFKESKPSVIELPISFQPGDYNLLNKAMNNLVLIEEKEKTSEIKQQSDDSFMESLLENQFPNNLSPEEREAFDLIQKEEEENELIEGIINEDLTEPLQDIINLQKKLEKYLPNKKAKENIEVLNQMIEVVNVFLIQEKK